MEIYIHIVGIYRLALIGWPDGQNSSTSPKIVSLENPDAKDLAWNMLRTCKNITAYISQRGQLVLAQVCLRSFHGLHRSICLWIVLALCLQTTGPWTDTLLLLERRLRSCVLGCFMWFYTEAWRYIPPSCHLSWAFRHDGTMFDPSHHYGGDGMDLDALGGIGEEYVIALYHS